MLQCDSNAGRNHIFGFVSCLSLSLSRDDKMTDEHRSLSKYLVHQPRSGASSYM
jgi:hypothetical protein